MDDSAKDPVTKPELTPVTVVKFALPVLLACLVMALTFAMGWEPWFGYASLIAGVLGSIMMVGRAYGINGPD